jgi:hypothetical protein
MSASTRTVPAQLSFGRIPSAFAGLALVILLAVAVAIVALNGSKTAAPAASSGFGHGPGDWYYTAPAAPAIGAPPLGYDHGSSNGQTVILPKTISHFGGWAGPRLSDGTPVYIPSVNTDKTKDDIFPGGKSGTGGGHNGARRAQ